MQLVLLHLLKSTIRSWVHNHHISALSIMSLSLSSTPLSFSLSVYPLRPTSLHDFSVFILYHSSLESFLSFLLSFPPLPLFSLSLSLSGFICVSPGSSRDPCKEPVSHDTRATNASARETVCTVTRAPSTP